MKVKSLFEKQLLLYILTIFFSVILLGGVLSAVYTHYYMEEAQDELIEQGRKISEEYTIASKTGDLTNLSYELQVLEDYMGASILLMNTDGILVMTSPGISKILAPM